MKHKVFTVYDQKARSFIAPFCMHQEGMATRVFGDCCNNKEHMFGRHPEDFTLFRIGEFDDVEGKLFPEPGHVVAQGLTLVRDDGQPDLFLEKEEV